MTNRPQEPSREERPQAALASEAPANDATHNIRRRVLCRHMKILFISANASTDQQLSLNEEYRKIERLGPRGEVSADGVCDEIVVLRDSFIHVAR